MVRDCDSGAARLSSLMCDYALPPRAMIENRHQNNLTIILLHHFYDEAVLLLGLILLVQILQCRRQGIARLT